MDALAQAMPLVLSYIDSTGLISAKRDSHGFDTSKLQLAETTGLAGEAVDRARNAAGSAIRDAGSSCIRSLVLLYDYCGHIGRVK